MIKLDFAELKKRFQVRTVLAITVESGRVAVDLVRRGDDGNQVAASFELPIGADAWCELLTMSRASTAPYLPIRIDHGAQ